MIGKLSEERKLAAVCGLYCGACTTYRAYKDKDSQTLQILVRRISRRLGYDLTVDEIVCEGCLSSKLMPWCKDCEFKKCSAKKDVTWCFECKEFPCKKLVDFNHDGVMHHLLVIDNLQEMKKMGVDKWLEKENQIWRCPKCGKRIHWYSWITERGHKCLK